MRETFQPYSKPNSQPISDRITKNSSNKEVFDRALPCYNDALTTSGYKELIFFNKRSSKNKRPRSRKIIWFSLNVKTNVARKFLKIVDKNFTKTHKFSKLFNRNNLKVSCSCLPNISSIFPSHNKKVLTVITPSTNPTCNCRKTDTSPLNGKCYNKSVTYLCNVKSSEQDEGMNYIGPTENTFKERWSQHRNSFKYEDKANSTELSKYVWSLNKYGVIPVLSWEIIDYAKSYRNGSKRCNLSMV